MRMIIFASLAILLGLGLPGIAEPGAITPVMYDGVPHAQNIFTAKGDPFLAGGAIGAPAGTEGLPAGDYFFQVTSTDGSLLLSSDPVFCRRVHIGADGFIDQVYQATYLKKIKGRWVPVDATHATGDGLDGEGLSVQLMPYGGVPDGGGKFRVWITSTSKFVGNPNQVDNPAGFHGFMPEDSKTACFKVIKGYKPYSPEMIAMLSFNDNSRNGIWDDTPLTEIEYSVTDPLGVENFAYTMTVSALVNTSPGGWYVVKENTPILGIYQTIVYVDGVLQAGPTAWIFVGTQSGEFHEVIFVHVPV